MIGLNRFFVFLIKCCIFFCIPDCLFDLFLRHIGTWGDHNALFLSGPQVFCRYLQDTIDIDIESHFNLRHPSHGPFDPLEPEIADDLVFIGHHPLSLENLDIHGCLEISACSKDLAVTGRNCRVALNNPCSHSSHCLYRQGKRGYVHEQHFIGSGLSCQFPSLDGGPQRDTLIGI